MKNFDTFLEDIEPTLVMLGLTHKFETHEERERDVNTFVIYIEGDLSSRIQVQYKKKDFHRLKRAVFYSQYMTSAEYIEARKPGVMIYTHGKLVKEVNKLIMKEIDKL